MVGVVVAAAAETLEMAFAADAVGIVLGIVVVLDAVAAFVVVVLCSVLTVDAKLVAVLVNPMEMAN